MLFIVEVFVEDRYIINILNDTLVPVNFEWSIRKSLSTFWDMVDKWQQQD